VKRNALVTQFRTGGANFAAVISRAAITANESAPVVLEITFVDVTVPWALTEASIVTTPCGPFSLNDGRGALTNR
jgi:hypothetical protein